MMNEETREFCLFISDDVEVFGVFGAHRKFLRIRDDFIFDGDGSGGSKILIAMKIFLCFTGRFTEFSESELSNSTVMGVVYWLLVNLTSAAWAIMRS